MEKLGELQTEIEIVRKELDVVAADGINAEKCYQTSVRLDRLIEDYMRYSKEKYHLEKCGYMT